MVEQIAPLALPDRPAEVQAHDEEDGPGNGVAVLLGAQAAHQDEAPAGVHLAGTLVVEGETGVERVVGGGDGAQVGVVGDEAPPQVFQLGALGVAEYVDPLGGFRQLVATPGGRPGDRLKADSGGHDDALLEDGEGNARR